MIWKKTYGKDSEQKNALQNQKDLPLVMLRSQIFPNIVFIAILEENCKIGSVNSAMFNVVILKQYRGLIRG